MGVGVIAVMKIWQERSTADKGLSPCTLKMNPLLTEFTDMTKQQYGGKLAAATGLKHNGALKLLFGVERECIAQMGSF